jgi:putative ABC transport system permease protein
MIADLKYVFRILLKSPVFSAVAILMLALGIGANTAIFSIVEATLLRPLPFPHPERLVRLYEAENESDARQHAEPERVDVDRMLATRTQSCAC